MAIGMCYLLIRVQAYTRFLFLCSPLQCHALQYVQKH